MQISIEHRLTEVEERSKSNTHRLEDLEKRQDNLDDLVSVVKVLAVREEAVEKFKEVWTKQGLGWPCVDMGQSKSKATETSELTMDRPRMIPGKCPC